MSPEKRGSTSPASSTTTANTSEQRRVELAQQALGVDFRDPGLLLQALVHVSYLNEQDEQAGPHFNTSNERLEFLGDAVLGVVVAEYLYRQHEDMDEGQLTVNRAMLVRREPLARWAREFNLGELLYIARSEGPVGDRTLAGLFEAVIGALYLDRGLEVVETFLHRLLDRDAAALVQRRDLTNYKGILQEIIQERDQTLPSYETVEASGPAHDRHFVVEAVHNQKTIGRGAGRSKRAAEQQAAKDAIDRLIEDDPGEEGADGGTL